MHSSWIGSNIYSSGPRFYPYPIKNIARVCLPPNIALFVIHILKCFYNIFNVSITFKVGARPTIAS